MKDPIKIVHKYKNNVRSIQYKIYIYVGPIVPKKIISILDYFKNKDFLSTLLNITKSDYKDIEEYYGDFWYEYFFISHHIKNTKDTITNIKKKELETKYGKAWYNKHFVEEHKQNITYSFTSAYHDYQVLMNKIKTTTVRKEIDLRTFNIDNNKYINDNDKIIDLDGGAEEPVNDVNDVDDDNVSEIVDENVFQEKIEETLNDEDIANLYAINEPGESNKEIVNTADLISKAINDTKWIKTSDKLENTFDSSQEEISYNADLKNVFNKFYIYDYYIFKDDTIRTIRNKITMSVPLSTKFGKTIRILPECQYLWTEYEYLPSNTSKVSKIDQVMIGQKWVRKNELLKIDIQPNESLKVYEKLHGNLSYIKESMGFKIRREDDEDNILRYYNDYITNNEIYLLDIYNELGLTYNVEQDMKKNLFDVYIKIYFSGLNYDRLEQIINLLNGIKSVDDNIKELILIESRFGIIRNDIKLDGEIEETIETIKIKQEKLNKLFEDNHIIQSIIHLNINDPKNISGTTIANKYNLYRIFDNYINNEKYPFIQYQTPNGYISYKFYSDKADNNLLSKWFETASFGLGFKIKMENDKYLSINLYESGRIEYKITWKEDEKATVKNINETYDIVRDLLKKINSENKKVKIILPSDDRFKYAFINTIQKFKIPEKFKINHNDLSEFSRYFYPYVALVIEPRKRQAKSGEINTTSKYGTYLRYKRINKYDNKLRMHLRILYFFKNYELSDKDLLNEVTKQFNITAEVAAKEIDYVRDKFEKSIRMRSKTKNKLTKITKSKPPGVGIDIQGREKENYKIRITGARDKQQLVEIVEFMKVLIYLYIETYLYKNPEYTKLKSILLTLNKIARRKNKVVEIVDYDEDIQTVRDITNLDKDRLGFKPDKGQNQWTRSCQNSGTDNKRRPDIYPEDQLPKLLSLGYKLNSKTGYYEKQVLVKGKPLIIKAITLSSISEKSNINYFTCDPDKNKENVYIGFLSKSNNPNNLCMPCCFKKDHSSASNKKKQDHFNKCMGQKETNEENTQVFTEQINMDKIYILQDTNKIQDGRYILLPKYLDIFFNKLWKHDNKIKNHYLYESNSGYFFKYTVKHQHYHFLIALADIFGMTIDAIKQKLIDFIKKDEDNKYFTYLNNGDIKQAFKTKETFINFIKSSPNLDYDILGELIEMPNVLSKEGITFYIFDKKMVGKEKYYILCLNPENNYIEKTNNNVVVLIKDDDRYFPIYKIQKKQGKTEKIKIYKQFKMDDKIFKELDNYYNSSCHINFINQIKPVNNLICKNIINILSDIKKQYIDNRNKCTYIELANNLFIPVSPSGIHYDYDYADVSTISWLSLDKNIDLLKEIKNDKLKKLGYIIKSVYYDNKNKDDINIISILLNNGLTVPIKSEYIKESKIKNLGFSIKFQPLEEVINKEILEYNSSNKKTKIDDRSTNVNTFRYLNESYNLFRLELSLFLNNNESLKNELIDIIRNSPKMNKQEKRTMISKIILNILENKIKKSDNPYYISDKLPDIKNYVILNIRDNCSANTSSKCNLNPHCSWKNDKCKLIIYEKMAIDYINKSTEEIMQDGIKFKEILQEGNYYVSDIVDSSLYTDRLNQKIINSTNYNINKIISEMFDNTNLPKIGKKMFIHTLNNIDEEIPQIIDTGKFYLQEIVPNKDSIIRAYINSYYWMNNSLYDIESRNLGYINELQTNMTYLFKAYIVDWILNNNTPDKFINKYFSKTNSNIFNSNINKFMKTSFNTDGKIELYILSHIIDKPIVVFDNYYNIKYIFNQGNVDITPEITEELTIKNKSNTIFLKFNFDNYNDIPRNIYSLYM